MGWDCTFHLVDPKSVAKAISTWVRGKAPPAEFVDAYEKGETIWATARERALNEPPEVAATIGCQLAILHAAALHPHHAERGVALSFHIDPTPRRCGPWVPKSLWGNPTTMLKALSKKRPELRYHEVFEHNSDTGVFIPAKNVAKAAEAVRQAMFDRDDPERDRYRGLYRTLRAAARHRLAYWEATDVAVAQTRPEMLAPLSAHYEWLAPKPTKDFPVSCSVAEDVVFVAGGKDGASTAIVAGKRASCAAASFSHECSARLQDGRWANYDNRALEVYDTKDGVPIERRLRLETTWSFVHRAVVRACGAGAVVVPMADRVRPSFFDGNALHTLDALPVGKRASRYGTIFHPHGAVTLRDTGNAVIMWNGVGYEIDAKGVPVGRPWSLGAKLRNTCSTLIPWGDDGFYFGEDVVLRRVRRGGSVEPVAKLSDLIFRLSPGPTIDGKATLLAVHTRHYRKRTQKHCATLVFPDDGESIELVGTDLDVVGLAFMYAAGSFWGLALRGRRQSLFQVPEERVLEFAPRSKLAVPKH